MGSHPLNLLLRFVLEIGALVALGGFGWARFDGAWRWVAAIGFPLAFAVLWGTFAVPGDPSRGGTPVIAVPGSARLLLELALFGIATWALHAGGHGRLAILFGAAVAAHYGLSWDRLLWLWHR